jgi:hypothetical protein
MRKKGRTFPYFDVDLASISKSSGTMLIVDRNSIQTTEEIPSENGKIYKKRVFNPDADAHIVKEITIPASTKAERNRIIGWMLELQDPAYTVVYDHRRNSFHLEYATQVWLDYLAQTYGLETEEVEDLEDDDEEYEEEDED